MLTDCIKCWSTPCTCGYDYRNYSIDGFTEFITGIISHKTKYEQLAILNNVLNNIDKTKEKDDL